ncbi:unnamed protein product [Tenebrio molitor]|nr:unnamed protein product [Tenebrio molitor]
MENPECTQIDKLHTNVSTFSHHKMLFQYKIQNISLLLSHCSCVFPNFTTVKNHKFDCCK